QQHSTQFYSDCYEGAYRGFHDINVQADFVHIDDIDQWDFLYLPIPVMLTSETSRRIRDWVAAGGTLVSEGCPAYWGDRAHVGEVQPNQGLDELFGARESYVEFTPDILDDLRFNALGASTWGGVYLQAYTPTTGEAVGWYEDGRVAAVRNSFGKGETLLLGTMPGRGYTVHDGENTCEFYRRVFEFSGKSQLVERSDERIRARVHDGDGGTYLWVANPKRQDIPVRVTVNGTWTFDSATSLRGADATVSGRTLTLTAPARDVTVVRLV
ncbi:MAG: beta-galactosidase trimerization domain-containing protein, partial [Spirochaetota bacterium]